MSANASLLGLSWINNGNKNVILAGQFYSDISWTNVDYKNQTNIYKLSLSNDQLLFYCVNISK